MSEESLKRKTINSVLWRIGEAGGNQLIQFIISVVLARLIMPDQFGLLVELTIFITIANVFIDSGFTAALIRKNNRTHADCTTVYWFNIVVSIVCYWIIFFCAPLVALFYSQPELTAILRVTSLSIIIGSFAGVHRTLLRADMNFKALTKYNIMGLIISGAVGIILAFKGFQVWALVFQNLTGAVVGTIFIWYKVKWRPSLLFAKESFKEFFGFGSKMLTSNLINAAYNGIYPIIIGKIYKPTELSFYGRADNLTLLTSLTPTNVLQSVTFPALSKLQDDDNKLKEVYRKMIRVSSFIVFPISLGLGAVAFPFINVFYTEKWIYVASLLSILCFGRMLLPVHMINLNYLLVKGRSDLLLKIELIKKIQGIAILCLTIPFGLKIMCIGMVIGSIFQLFWHTYYTGKFLKMGIFLQLRDVWPSLLLACVMFFLVKIVANFFGNDIFSLVISIFTGIVIYVGGAYLFKFSELQELKNIKR